MPKLGEAWVNIRANMKPLQAGLKKAFGMVKSVMRRMTRIITRAAKWAAVGFVAISTAAIKMAMDAQESENLFEVSMGRMAEATRYWSDRISKSLGLNAFEVRKYVSTFNVMLESMGIASEKTADMSRKLVELAYDMASFYNLKPAEAFQKIQAGITGEIEPLKRIGILINETTVKTWALNKGLGDEKGNLSEVEKVMARYALIMEQTIKAQGDLQRTAGSATNVLRSLRSQVAQVAIAYGTELLPVVTKWSIKMRDWLAENKNKFTEWGRVVRAQIERVHFYFRTLYDLVQAKGWEAGLTKLTIDFIRAMRTIWNTLKADVFPAAVKIGEMMGKGIKTGIEKEFPEWQRFIRAISITGAISRWTPKALAARGGAAVVEKVIEGGIRPPIFLRGKKVGEF